ncbi:NADH-quinone oxidoreductase subunit M [Burkholderia cepacia]|uniref:complex I subunit 4 family protein n=1 Tax=Burkholderia cepacia TaxID=292 RepID=UPI000F5E03A3|nr:NADH-quinone oxidoreductase subunit M [Burkholderia cepacia]RQZ58963.1 NADH-quinone oxidoreductase subunit M [Burkholderia cepacia]
MHSIPFVTLSVWTPVLFGVAVRCAGSDGRPTLTRMLALVGALAGLVATMPLLFEFDTQAPTMQFVENRPWLATLGISWRVGVDGVSLWMVVLTALTTLLIVGASWQAVTTRVAQYFGAVLILSGLMVGVFVSLDGMLFFVFFESTLIPLYLLIGAWGGKHRSYAAVKFFFMSFAGSLLLLAAMLYLFGLSHTFDMHVWHEMKLDLVPQLLIFCGFLAAFAVKLPMWPVHGWLKDAYAEGPIGAAIMLGMVKIGGYGFLRFMLPIAPDASRMLAPAMIALSLFTVIYASLIALVQTELSALLAYSTIAHMGLVTLGLFLFNQLAVEGAIVQMISYGLVSGALLICTGMLYERTQTRSLDALGGVANVMPRYATLAVLFSMANLGLPGTSGFVGEFLVIMGAIKANFWIGGAAALTLVLGAAYTLRGVRRVIFGAVKNERVARLTDLGRRERALLVPLAVIVLGLGVAPRYFIATLEQTTSAVVQDSMRSKLTETSHLGERMAVR